ncbi:hypothetical protein [Actomonas aquatica]|uniref:PD-(D/E)XK endonuclease-like domain-containing protein n=1 Tax=Actomonas aquatica TaxID=2866162 RepID=A0ABZ1C970_9BACT|nr:hypothetical protein [Opitutus sp. WL0086]WRQ88056.1 hypothetical protein K1X11_001470 [Opitutus sp. WL0086]
MNITDFTRSLNSHRTAQAFLGVAADQELTASIKPNANIRLIAKDCRTAGQDLHGLLKRMADDRSLEPHESAYFGWISKTRSLLRKLGVGEIQMNVPLAGSWMGTALTGACDLLVHGGPKAIGVVEIKTILRGEQTHPRSRDLVQLASYTSLAEQEFGVSAWASLAYCHFETRTVRIFVFRRSDRLLAPIQRQLEIAA